MVAHMYYSINSEHYLPKDTLIDEESVSVVFCIVTDFSETKYDAFTSSIKKRIKNVTIAYILWLSRLYSK